ncbi:flagellar hook-basal body complex protein FliE [Paenibacillus sediminis]|uniref:Flagellar hook-basal body complex protein FliE n=1 Tax=Paenibacillus sediminis TaxID=664909 RepID=A0ABS4H1M0_9BACL|nr:flagellar hook-basal body complex protein FliE [Paenibacillus sediminis]MBP1936429.1 flagellar hook-basal body complex protein FliE [Paenibacillus sediminis]
MIQNTMLSPLNVIQPAQSSASNKPATPAESIKNFGEYLQDAIDSVSQQEQNVQKTNDKFLLGEVNVDEVMMTSEQALLSLQLTSQVRNKVIEAYQEIMRTQL